MSEDYYIVLGVSRGADLNRIKKAYRSIAKQYHPDITHSKESAKRFMQIKEAYETLADEDRRREYDSELERQGEDLRISRSDIPGIVRQRRSPFDEMDRFFSRVDDFFSGFMPGFFDKGRLMPEKDLYIEVILSPAEAVQGGLFPITVPVIESCQRCAKTGLWEDFFCPICLGRGRVRSEREFSLSIPPNVKHGTEIRLSMEDIGLRDVNLNILVMIDPDLEPVSH